MPNVGESDFFESVYMPKLEAALAPHGLILEYRKDLATLDRGLHLYDHGKSGSGKAVSQVRVWLQAKGVTTQTMPVATATALTEIPVRGLPVEAVRFWYAAAEPVYLVVYVEALDEFFAEDVREVVDRLGGRPHLASLGNQEEMTLKIRKTETLESAVARMPRHRSLRIDGPAFRGRPLGHRYDPLRSELSPMRPDDFEALIDELLRVHDFQHGTDLDLQGYLGTGVGRVSMRTGTLHLTYEWTSPLFTEFGVGPDTDFRIESPPEHAQGPVAVVVHSDPLERVVVNDNVKRLVQELQTQGIPQALVFFNATDASAHLGGWRMALEPLVTIPQGLGSIAFNLLTATSVYLDFADRVTWEHINYLWA
jgi:hypothetical protein